MTQALYSPGPARRAHLTQTSPGGSNLRSAPALPAPPPQNGEHSAGLKNRRGSAAPNPGGYPQVQKSRVVQPNALPGYLARGKTRAVLELPD